MERTIIFCMLFFCSSMALAAPSPRILKYKQLFKKIQLLGTIVKDKDVELLHTPENPVDGCLSTAVACFQSGVLKLQPENSQVNSEFIQTIKVFKNFTFRSAEIQQCESSCESYEKKSPKEFLKSFEKLIQQLFKN